MALTTAVDTYCTLEEANTYFGDRLASTAWIDAMDLDREAALRMAFTALERLYWVGSQTRRPWSSGTAYTPGDDVVVRAANGTAAAIFLNTLVAGCLGMLGWLTVEQVRDGKPTTFGAASGVRQQSGREQLVSKANGSKCMPGALRFSSMPRPECTR